MNELRALLDILKYYTTADLNSPIDHIEMSDDYMSMLLTYEGAKTAMLDYGMNIEAEQEHTDIRDAQGRFIRTILRTTTYYIDNIPIVRAVGTKQLLRIACRDETSYTKFNEFYFENISTQQQTIEINTDEWLKIINL